MLKDEFIIWKYCFWKLQKLLKLIYENWSMLSQASYMKITLLKHFFQFFCQYHSYDFIFTDCIDSKTSGFGFTVFLPEFHYKHQ